MKGLETTPLVSKKESKLSIMVLMKFGKTLLLKLKQPIALTTAGRKTL